jgi:hypothetical protein
VVLICKETLKYKSKGTKLVKFFLFPQMRDKEVIPVSDPLGKDAKKASATKVVMYVRCQDQYHINCNNLRHLC